MPRTYSIDPRERVIGSVTAGTSAREAARRFNIGASTAVKWVQRWRRSGSVAAKPMAGGRPIGRVPHGHWKTTTFVAGPRHDAITAPMAIDRPMNGVIFKAYVDRMLAPTLAPGDIVVMDNPSSHKVDGVRRAIEARGATLLYPPPYSPDLNPIEMAFAKLKALPRKAAERSLDARWRRIGKILDTVTPQECRNYFHHAGYA